MTTFQLDAFLGVGSTYVVHHSYSIAVGNNRVIFYATCPRTHTNADVRTLYHVPRGTPKPAGILCPNLSTLFARVTNVISVGCYIPRVVKRLVVV